MHDVIVYYGGVERDRGAAIRSLARDLAGHWRHHLCLLTSPGLSCPLSLLREDPLTVLPICRARCCAACECESVSHRAAPFVKRA